VRASKRDSERVHLPLCSKSFQNIHHAATVNSRYIPVAFNFSTRSKHRGLCRENAT
jgi:hypothetical protein